MMPKPNLLSERESYTAAKLEEFRRQVADVKILEGYRNLCIYITGSFGRREASEHSDLDLFFINRGTREEANLVSRLSQFRIFTRLVEIADAMGFPDFSNDGEYLKIHYLHDMRTTLGGPKDDYENHFTARLLLLLESASVFNEEAYNHAVNECVNFYYRDYHDHPRDFKAIFLANDIIRFWKTFCLNYEHRRNRPEDDPQKRAANHLKNLKLKFSRLLTCSSMILCLAKGRHHLTPEQVVGLVTMAPQDRVLSAANGIAGTEAIVSPLFDDYAWFLERTGRPKADTLQWIAIQAEREEAFRRAKNFGDRMFSLLVKITDDDTIRYLVM